MKKRRRRRPHTHPGVVPAITHEPTDLWTADFKGHFKTRDGIYCYPLTVADQHTRYLLACHGLASIHGWRVRPVFERLFREYGLPRAIRTDTLKYEATKPSQQNRVAQQRRFQTFRIEYNVERPHEALGGKPPASCFTRSPRPYPATLPALEYPGHFLVSP